MLVKDQYLEWVLGQLSVAGRVSSRRMFGSIGLYYHEVPADVLEDPDECSLWVGRAVAAAAVRRSPRRKTSGKARTRVRRS